MARERSGTQPFQGDSILFHGSKVPAEVRKMIPHLSNLKLEKFKKLIQVVCCSFENPDVDPNSLQSLVEDNLPEETINQLFSGLYTVIKATLRQPLASIKHEAVKAELLSYKFPENVIDEIIKNVFGKSSLNRVLVPTVLMEVKSSDGNIRSFEVSLSKFNELEYDVAFILKEMEDLEKRNILKIQD